MGMPHYLPALVRFPTSTQCLAHIYFVGTWSPYLIPVGCKAQVQHCFVKQCVHTIGPHRYPVFTPLPGVTDRLRSPAPKAPDAEPQPLSLVAPQISIFFFPHIPERKSKDFWKKWMKNTMLSFWAPGLR